MHQTPDTNLDDARDDLAPEERLEAAAQLLARGIRRLLTRTTSTPGEDALAPPGQTLQLPVNTEKCALPVVPSRALMTRTRTG
jgi:hypothetical protein